MTLIADGETIDGNLFGATQPCFGCGPQHPHGFRLAFVREGDEIVTRFVPGPLHQGPPGLMHGGLVSTVADELAAWVVIGLCGKFGFTTSFEARFRKPLRIGVPVDGRGSLVKAGTRLVDVAVGFSQQGEAAFTGAFRFILLDERAAAKMLGGPIPEEWRRFCR